MIVILGASGYLGTRFRQFFERSGVRYCPLGRKQVNYYDVDELSAALFSCRPSLVINCAGYTGRPNVDACEDHKAECLAANAALPAVAAEACQRLDVPLGHVSSGCIFTGNGPGGRGFSEQDRPNFTFQQNNCSFYSGCKALGEEALEPFGDCYIWRLRIPFDNTDSSRNYISKLLRYQRLLEARNSLSNLDEFVEACYQCYQDSLPPGIYNLTNTGSVTTRQVVELIQQHRLANRPFSFFRDEQEFMQIAAKTPRSNCILDNSKALAAGLQLSPVHEALDRCLTNWQPGDHVHDKAA
jgi:UDP-glucose 4,6-dehydratase/3,5-epimerase/4-reductase